MLWLTHEGLWGIFFGVLGEAFLLPLPAETLATFGSIEASKGFYPLWLLLIVLFSATYIGSITAYWIGRGIGKVAMLRVYKKLRIKDEHIALAEKQLVKYSVPLLLAYRFLVGIRGLIPYVAGANRIPFAIFALTSAIGAALWVVVFAVFGRLLESLVSMLSEYQIHTLILIVFVALVSGYAGYRIGKRAGLSSSDHRP